MSEGEKSDKLPGVLNELLNLVQVFRDERAQMGKAIETALNSHRETLREVVRQELAAATASVQQSSAQGQRVLEGAAGQLREEAFGLRTVRLWFHWKLVGAVVLAVVLGLMGLNAYVYTTLKADAEALRREARLSRALDTYLTDTLYPTLSAAQQQELDALYTRLRFLPPDASRRRQDTAQVRTH